ncbi:MAG: MBL fold metallo-hydrolase [Flavobacteriaceae bacterium]|nr:MBL fold metallo-hydrolase [Flavobacteriaceae bacterium]
MKLTFLGTGTSQGIPVIGSQHPVCQSNDSKDVRLRTSALLNWNKKNYVIDCGPDFRQQLLKNPIDYLDGILFTHAHADHTSGLDDIRPFCFRQGPIEIHLTLDVLNNLKKRFGYILSDKNKYPGTPSVKVNLIEEAKAFKLGGKIVMPVKAAHYKSSVIGFKIDKLAYMTDVKSIDEKSKNKLMNLDVLVLNCLRLEPHPSHLNLEEALNLINEIKPKNTYFTHISHLLGFHHEISKSLPDNVFLAYDNLSITC